MSKSDKRASCIAFIPARAGSVRVPGKNVRPLAGHPLIAYTISVARASEVFDRIVVSTDSEHTKTIALHYGAEVPFLRPKELATATSPDIEWVEFTLKRLWQEGGRWDCFSILRPTNPFRQAETIQRAWKEFGGETGIDSLRAVEKCKQHPAKMWVVRGKRMLPLLPLSPAQQPWHSSQYASLPEVHVQNASLEIAWCRLVFEERSIAGNCVMPFLTQGYEGFDINDEDDWGIAEYLLEKGKAMLPPVSQLAFEKRMNEEAGT
jgi:N-acylneuraminate cytidylyltransferase